MIHQSDWTPALLFFVSDENESGLILGSKLYLAIGMIAILPGVPYTIASSIKLSNGKVSITLSAILPPSLLFCSFPFPRTGYLLYLGHILRHYNDQLFLPYSCLQSDPTWAW